MQNKRFLYVALILSILLNTIFAINYLTNDVKVSSVNKNNYDRIVNYIVNEFSINEYEQLLKNYNHMLGTPINGKDKDLINRQKLCLFKSNSKKTVILLNISYSNYATVRQDFHCTEYYSPIFNSNSNKYANSYAPDIPDEQIAFYSFSFKGCNIAIVGMSSNNNPDTHVAATEVILFANTLIPELESNF